MARVTKEMVDAIDPPPRRVRLPRRWRPTTRWFASSPFLSILVLGAVLAPDLWLRALATGVALFLMYGLGLRDGRRDLALDLLGGRRDDRPIERPPSRGEEPTA